MAVAENGSIANAAAILNISAPSISAAITQLEKEFSVKFFVRHHAKGLSLTREGTHFFNEAKKIVEQADNMNKVAHSISDSFSGPMTLGALGSINPIVVPELCKKFLEEYPEVQLTFRDASHTDLIKQLHNAEIGIALTFDFKIPKDIIFTPLVKLPPYVLLSAENPLANKASISLEELKEVAFIQVSSAPMREYALSLFQQHNFKPNIIYKSPYSSISGLVAHDYGFSFVYLRPKLEQNLDASQLVTIPLDGDHQALVMGLAAVDHNFSNPVIRAFEEFCINNVNEKEIPGALAPHVVS